MSEVKVRLMPMGLYWCRQGPKSGWSVMKYSADGSWYAMAWDCTVRAPAVVGKQLIDPDGNEAYEHTC